MQAEQRLKISFTLKEFGKDLKKDTTENVDKKTNSEQKEMSRDREAESMMTDEQKVVSEQRAGERTEEKAT